MVSVSLHRTSISRLPGRLFRIGPQTVRKPRLSFPAWSIPDLSSAGEAELAARVADYAASAKLLLFLAFIFNGPFLRGLGATARLSLFHIPVETITSPECVTDVTLFFLL